MAEVKSTADLHKPPPPGPRKQSEAVTAMVAAARTMYETMPGATFDLVAKAMGIKTERVRKWKQFDAERGIEWKRNGFAAIPQLSERAHALADSFKASMAERGIPMSDEVARREAEREFVVDHAVQQRAAIIDRHRKEWAAPRKLAYEAIQGNNFDKAKLAKISAETLTLIQTGECRAYGIDATTRGNGGGTVVVVGRDDGAPAEVGSGDVREEAGRAAEAIEMPAEVRDAQPTGPVVGDTAPIEEDGDVF